jgi:hypothetical protein
MTPRCPSDLALEKLLLDPAGTPLAPHLDGCPRCQARLAEMKRQGEDFLRYVFPATVEAVEAAAARRPAWDLVRWLAPLPALAAAAAVILVVGPGGPPEGYLGVKGGNSMGLAVFLQRPDGPHPARDGEVVPASASVRFKVRPSRPCRLWLLSVDATGQVSRLFPADGDGGVEVVRTTELPGGAVLDGQQGPERFLALCAPGPIPYARVEGAVRAAVSAGADAVRSMRTIPGLPAGTYQDSVLLEKKP